MSTPATVNELHRFVGQEVTLSGWLYNSRSSGKVQFLIVRDGTGLCQCVLERSEQTEPFFETARRLRRESSLQVTGTVHADQRAPGGHELKLTGLNVVHEAEDFPISPKPHGIDFLMKHRHLWLRSRRQTAVMRVRHTLVDAIRRFYNDRGFYLVDTPILAPAAGESTSTLFEVDYYDAPVYLAQTGQLYLESACMALGKVYCFGPTFRAEKSKTRRHLTEFWMVEPEVAYADLDDCIRLAEDFIIYIVRRVLKDNSPDLEELGRDTTALEAVRAPFVRLSYTDAAEMLRGDEARGLLEKDLTNSKARIDELRKNVAKWEQQRNAPDVRKGRAEQLLDKIAEARDELADLEETVANIPKHMKLAANFTWGKDLGGSDETIISRLHDRPVVVHRYPKEAKAFYMKINPEDPRTVLNFDVLAPEGYGEIIGGSQREDDYRILLERIQEELLPQEAYEWYLDLRRYGSVPHGGFGLGVERTLAWICGLKHIRETIAFPRLMDRLYP
jgi:asparaginyl-tRNA synthetase